MSRRSVVTNSTPLRPPDGKHTLRSVVPPSPTNASVRGNPVKARDRIALKNTRDGLIEQNATTGERKRISKREADFDLRGEKPERRSYSQLGNSSGKNAKRRQVYRYSKTDTVPETKQSAAPEAEKPTALKFNETKTAQTGAEQAANPDTAATGFTADTLTERAPAADTPQRAPTSNGSRVPQKPPNVRTKPPPKNKRQYRQTSERQTIKHDAPAVLKDESELRTTADVPKSTQHTVGGAVQSEYAPPSKLTDKKTDSRLNTENHSRLKFAPDEAATAPRGKRKKPKSRADRTEKPAATETVEPVETPRTHDGISITPDFADAPKTAEKTTDTPAQPESAPPSKATDGKPKKPAPDVSALKTDKPGKLKFTPDEAAPEKPKIHHNRKLNKAQNQADRAVTKLEKAQSKLPKKRKLHSKRVFDETKGKAKRKLYFESEVKTQSQHLKGALPLRPVKAAGNSVLAFGHKKMFQVERENVATEAAHKSEMFAEGVVRSALRFRKTAPYRKVEKLERKAAKKTINLTYQKALAENPKLKSNLLSRAFQKRKIKKDYAKAAREAQKAAKQAKKAGSAVTNVGKALVSIVKRHPAAAAAIVLILLLLFVLMSLIGAFGSMGGGGLGGILTASYLAEDADIDNAELAYSEWEVDLQEQIANTESSHAGYDEYRYNVGDISHNPYELMAYLTVKYQNFSYSAVESDLRTLFGEQYTLTFTPSVETRYRTVTKTDPDTGESYEEQEPYDWHVMTVTLTARSFSDVALSHLDGDQLAHYALLLQTKGSRQYLGNPFGDMNWLSYVTSYYGYRIHPINGVKDIHRGVDIGLPTGTEIRSGQDGTVTFAGYSGDYGNVVVIENDKGLVSKYAHCDSIFVSAGQTVMMGDVIATVGNTGNSTGPHLHLEVLKNGQYLNPLYFCDSGSFNLTPIYGIPGAPMGDGTYAALIAEAERHLGKPYVYGANGPNSFDCSSYICYILTQSGVKNMPRTSAQGVYNQCTPIPESERQPGDLVFFHSTYSTPNTVTHVGLYVGNGWIIHAGSPIQYTQIDGNAYWQAHLYSYGRISSD